MYTEPEIVLDISRLLSRLLHRTPTGIDRVEMSYARQLQRLIPERLSFSAVHAGIIYGRLSKSAVEKFLSHVEAQWQGNMRPIGSRAGMWLHAARQLLKIRPGPIPMATRKRVLLQVSPHHLDNEALMRSIIYREGASLLCLVHDLIPIEFPEYARPNGTLQHLRRIHTVSRLADGILTNSEDTRRTILPYLRETKRDVPIKVVPLGVSKQKQITALGLSARPYFVCVGTIEPRKNHLLLLNIWRRLLSQAKDETPRLILIGRRGWENENIIDMLDRCPVLREGVEEHCALPDASMQALLGGARALLMPSFAEGYGLPVAEALDLKIPVICSDLPALREAGGNAPEFLDPLDGPGWISMIKAYSQDPSPRRDAQMTRIAVWRAPDWQTHVQEALAFATEVAAAPRRHLSQD